MKISITVNLPNDTEVHFDVPMASVSNPAGTVNRLINAAMELQPTWTSMVVTFTNPDRALTQDTDR